MRHGESIRSTRRTHSFHSNIISRYFKILSNFCADLIRFFRILNFSSASSFLRSVKSLKSFRSFRSSRQDAISGLLLLASILLLVSRLLKYAGSGGINDSLPHEEKRVIPTRGYLYGWTTPQYAYEISMNKSLTHHASGSSLVGRISGPFSRVTISTVAAGDHTLVVTSSGALFSFGRDWNDAKDRSGQLGREGRLYNPIRVRGELFHKIVVGAAVGMYHSVAFTRDGKVFTWGLNRRGQLGRPTPTKNDAFSPGVVSGPLVRKKVVQVAAGRAHTLALTSDGKVYTWGLNYFTSELITTHENARSVKSLSSRTLDLLATPRLVTGALSNKKVTSISSGPDHWLALTSDNRVFSCGTGYGPDELTSEGFSTAVLGRPKGESFSKPGEVTGVFQDENPTFIAAGPGSSYTIAGSILYSWGDFSANIGRNDPIFPPYEPAEVALAGEYVDEVSVGHGFSIALSTERKIYTWGTNDHGQLGRPAGLMDPYPKLMDSFDKFQVVSVHAGSNFAMAICHHPSGMNPEDDIDRLVGMKVDKFFHGNVPSIKHERHRNAIVQLEKGLIARISPDGYDTRFKNPCWFENPGGIFCFPYFFITGSSRCGITDLYNRVARSGLEGVIPLKAPNPNWWHLSNLDADWYLDLFKEASEEILKNPYLVVGESSPDMMIHSGLSVHGKPNQLDLAEVLYAFLPGAKLVILLRNPVDRCYSAYYHYEKLSGKDFNLKVSEDIRVMKKCFESFDFHSCISNMHISLKHIVNSMYAYPLENWLQMYARGEIFILRYEDYIRDVRNSLEKVIDFLELPKPSMEKLNEIAKLPMDKEMDPEPGMSEKTRMMLNEFFAPHNKKLAELLEDEKFLWG